MRKITKESVKALFNNDNLNKQNMCVSNGVMKLHGNDIAWLEDTAHGKTITISDAGWDTVTTKERLNGILDYLDLGKIFQKDFVWYYLASSGCAKPFNGSMTFNLRG